MYLIHTTQFISLWNQGHFKDKSNVGQQAYIVTHCNVFFSLQHNAKVAVLGASGGHRAAPVSPAEEQPFSERAFALPILLTLLEWLLTSVTSRPEPPVTGTEMVSEPQPFGFGLVIVEFLFVEEESYLPLQSWHAIIIHPFYFLNAYFLYYCERFIHVIFWSLVVCNKM